MLLMLHHVDSQVRLWSPYGRYGINMHYGIKDGCSVMLWVSSAWGTLGFSIPLLSYNSLQWYSLIAVASFRRTTSSATVEDMFRVQFEKLIICLTSKFPTVHYNRAAVGHVAQISLTHGWSMSQIRMQR